MTCATAARLLLVLAVSTFSVFELEKVVRGKVFRDDGNDYSNDEYKQIMFGHKMTVVGLPLPIRQERHWTSGSQDILAGKDFLSVFLKSSAPQTRDSYTDSEVELQSSYDDFGSLSDRVLDGVLLETTTDRLAAVFEETTVLDTYIRTSREVTQQQYDQSTEIQSSNSLFSTSDSPSSEESVIVAVRVSTSVDRQISKNINQLQPRTKTIFSTLQTVSHKSEEASSSTLNSLDNFSSTVSNVPQSLENNNAQSSVIDEINSDIKSVKNDKINSKELFSDKNSLDDSSKDAVLSRQQPNLISRSSKSELNVDEAEPITHNRENRNNRDLSAIQPITGYSGFQQTNSYPSLIQGFPTSVNSPFNFSDFLQPNENSGQLQPFHHSFIYHDQPQNSARGRSVSYSTLIQAVSPGHKNIVQDHEGKENRNIHNDNQELRQEYNSDFQTTFNDKPHETLSRDHQSDFTAQFSSTKAPLVISSSTSITKSSGSPERDNSHTANNSKWALAYSKLAESSTPNSEDWVSAYSQQESSTNKNNWSPSSTQTENSAAAEKDNKWGKFFSFSSDGQQSNSPPPNPPKNYGRPEQNYEIDEAVSVHTNGRTHGIQAKNIEQGTTSTEKPKEDPKEKDKKTGYVVEGRNYRRYRVEEKTPDGFIVGEYGVVSNDDGSLRGVRYTADGSINPSVIYNALMKFLSL